MESLMNYTSQEFGTIRTLDREGEPWFVGKDVADILGYQNGSRDINRHVDEEDRQKAMLFDGNQDKETIVINESGLYSLVTGSKLPTAKKFKHWVTSEVLPSIRKTGSYSVQPVSNMAYLDQQFNLLKAQYEELHRVDSRIDVIERRVESMGNAFELNDIEEAAAAIKEYAARHGDSYSDAWNKVYDRMKARHHDIKLLHSNHKKRMRQNGASSATVAKISILDTIRISDGKVQAAFLDSVRDLLVTEEPAQQMTMESE